MKTIGLALLILALPVLSGLTPDPETMQGHIETCPNCSDPESNPIRCKAAREVARRIYERNAEMPLLPGAVPVAFEFRAVWN